MKRKFRKLMSMALALVMVLTAFCIPSYAAAEAVLRVESNDLYGTADTEGFSTLKAFTDSALTVPGDKVSYTGSVVLGLDIGADSSGLDISTASVTLAPGDGYDVNDLIFSGGTLGLQDGKVVFTMNEGDLEWNNYGYPVGEGGMEWSCIGGNGNGNYYFNLSLSGVKVNGSEIAPVTFRVHIYIYGREFTAQSSPSNPSGSTWGAGGYDSLVFAETEKKPLSETVSVGNEPVWTWVGDDSYGIPVFCDDQTDNFYINWPSGVDAAALTDSDVTVTLHSQYGDAYVLTPNTGVRTFDQNGISIPNGEYNVFADSGVTQVSVNLRLWAATPVYNTMTITVNTDKVSGYDGNAENTWDIGSVYTNMVQLGGGLDLDNTVTTVSLFGIKNIGSLSVSDVFKDVTYYYVYREGQGPRAKELYFLTEGSDGTYSVTENKDEATVYPSDGTNAQLLGHTIFTTNNPGSVEMEYNGQSYKFDRKLSYGMAAAQNLIDPKNSAMEIDAGYVPSAKGSWDDCQRWAWLYFTSEDGWTKPSDVPSETPTETPGDYDAALKLDKLDWVLSEDGQYWFATINYCTNIVVEDIQYMKIYVPAAYLSKGQDGEITINADPVVNGFTAATAPILFKNNCEAWNSSRPKDADSEWISNGFVHVECGARSRDADEGHLYGKSPAQVIDLKSGLRALRLNAELIPGDPDRIISVGTSGGGQMSSMLGATGNMSAYYEMLWENGAAGVKKNGDGSYTSTINDDVFGCMCFCPIASIDHASIAQAWMRYDSSMNGRYEFTPFQLQLEKDMAVAFCEYINSLGLVNEKGEILSFDIDPETGKPDPRSGSYYNQTLQNMSDALNCFATADIFPYTVRVGMGPSAVSTDYATFDDLFANYKEQGTGHVQGGLEDWIVKNTDGTYSVLDFAGFFHGTGLTRFKGIPAFDAFDKSTENDAFGQPGVAAVHYSASIAELLERNYDAYASLEGFAEVKDQVDEFIVEAKDESLARQLYLMDSMQIMLNVSKGEETADVAPNWRMRMGTADQNSFAIAYNFCLTAAMAGADVDYHLIWAMGHGNEEGTTTGTFVEWVNEICADVKENAPHNVEAIASHQAFQFDGAVIDSIAAYNIGGYNFVKLRDVAMLLNGTGSQFDIQFDDNSKEVEITTAQAYHEIGGELAGRTQSDANGVVSGWKVLVNGSAVNAEVYLIGDENYFKLRDLGAAIGFHVDYEESTNTAVVNS